MQSAQQIKDFEFAARFVFVSPPTPEAMEAELRSSGVGEADKIKQLLESAAQLVEHARASNFYDAVVEPEAVYAAAAAAPGSNDIAGLYAAIFGGASEQLLENANSMDVDDAPVGSLAPASGAN